MDKTTVIVTIVVAIFGSTGFWSLLNTYILNKKKAKSDETKLIMGIAYRNIIAQCEKYIKRGYIEPDEFNELFEKANTIVSHAGMGTILSALQKHKPIIIFPRIAALGEHRNEHQLATARKFKELGTIYVAMDEQELKTLILRKDLVSLNEIGANASESLILSLEEFIG